MTTNLPFTCNPRRIKQRRRPPMILLPSLLLFTSLLWRSEGFVLNQRQLHSSAATVKNYNGFLSATKEDESWSKSALNMDDPDDQPQRAESPLGVRRRVKAVLERARNRTGVKNTSVSSVIADAASIGGLGGVLQANGTVDVALDLQMPPPTSNGFKDLASRSSPVVKDLRQPKLVLQDITRVTRRDPQVDAINADVPAAFSEPLPFFLPNLSNDKKQLLAQGERIQEQSKMGREGSGYVVMDVKAPPYVVWECLLDFESYPQTIPTVREVTMYTSDALTSGYHAEQPVNPGTDLRHYGTPSTTRAAFCLSKFRLNIAAIHNYRPHPDGDYMIFTLDPECTNMVLQAAKGIWHTQPNPDGRGEVRMRLGKESE